MANAKPVVPPAKPQAKAKTGPDMDALLAGAEAGAGVAGAAPTAAFPTTPTGEVDIAAIVAQKVAEALAGMNLNPNAQVVPAVSSKAQTVQLDDGTKRQDF